MPKGDEAQYLAYALNLATSQHHLEKHMTSLLYVSLQQGMGNLHAKTLNCDHLATGVLHAASCEIAQGW